MTTLAALTQSTLNRLYGAELVERPLEDRINGAIANGTTEVVAFDTPAMWDPDDFVEYRVDGEITRLVSDTVQKRGQRGTTAASKLDNAEVTKNPPYFIVDVQEKIEEVVRGDLWPHVWTWHRDSLSATETDFMYDLDEYVTEVVLVYQENIDADEKFRSLPPGWWDTERQIDATVATEGSLLILRRVYDYDETVFYLAKRRPHVDDLANMSDELADLIPWAAAAKMLAGRGGQVKAAASRSNKDQEGGYLQVYRGWMSEFIRMRDELHRALMSEVREDRRWRGPQRNFVRSW